MSIKEKIENNIVVILIGTAIATSGVIYSVLNYFFNEKIEIINSTHKSDMQKLESTILSIERNIGDEKYFDIRNFFYNEASSPSELEFLPKGGFYANTKIENFTFKEYHEAEFIRKLLNMNQEDFEALISLSPKFEFMLSEEYKDITKNAPVYTWFSNDSVKYYDGYEEVVARQYMTTQIITKDFLKQSYNLGIEFASKNNDEDEPDSLSVELDSLSVELVGELYSDDTLGIDNLETLKEELGEHFDHDLISIFFFHKLEVHMSSAVANNSLFNINKLQKLGNVLYMKSTTKRKVSENEGGEERVFYEVEELFLIADGENFYMARSVIPGFEPIPRGDKVIKLNIWLNGLKFIV